MASSSLGSQSCKCGYSTLVSQLFCSRAALKRVRELRSSIADGPAIPSAAKDLENGLTAAANPWGCPPPGGGVRAAFEPRGRFPRAWKKPVVVVDAPGDPRNLGRRFCVHPLECSNAVVRGRRGAEPERTPIAAATTSVCSLSTATREVVGGDGHQCSLFRGYQSLDTLAAAPERDADHGAASAPDL